MTYPVDPRVDDYIDALPDWQQAICREVRETGARRRPRGSRNRQVQSPSVLCAGGQHLRLVGRERPRQPVALRRRDRPIWRGSSPAATTTQPPGPSPSGETGRSMQPPSPRCSSTSSPTTAPGAGARSSATSRSAGRHVPAVAVTPLVERVHGAVAQHALVPLPAQQREVVPVAPSRLPSNSTVARLLPGRCWSDARGLFAHTAHARRRGCAPHRGCSRTGVVVRTRGARPGRLYPLLPPRPGSHAAGLRSGRCASTDASAVRSWLKA